MISPDVLSAFRAVAVAVAVAVDIVNREKTYLVRFRGSSRSSSGGSVYLIASFPPSLPFGATEESSFRRYRRRLDLSRVFAGGIRPSEIRRIESRQEKRHLVVLVPLRQLVQRVAQRLLRRQGRMRGELRLVNVLTSLLNYVSSFILPVIIPLVDISRFHFSLYHLSFISSFHLLILNISSFYPRYDFMLSSFHPLLSS